MNKVGIVKCHDYNYDEVINSVYKLLDGLENVKLLKPGKVLLKVNLLKKNKPEDAVTTHPFVVEGVVRFLQGLGHEVVIGDSPGGPFLVSILKSVYDTTGMTEVANRTNCKLNFDIEYIDVFNSDGIVLKNMKLVKSFMEADYIISCGKVKTHGMMTYTGAVKNLFGMIPGVTKADYHLNLNDTNNFANMLIDICEYVKPTFSIMDGIEGMEGDGPSSGHVRKLGLIFASENAYTLDYAITNTIGIYNAPTIMESIKRRLTVQNLESIEYFGDNIDDMNIEPFRLPKSSHINFINGRIPKFIESYILDNVRPYPIIINEICISCGICAKNCPAKVIDMSSGKPIINTKDCIRCFCCHELCPKKAVDIKRHPLHKLIFRE